MLPEGLEYVSSWIDPKGSICFQLMETAEPDLFDVWTGKWNDLIDFEVTPVLDSALFWLQRQPST